MAAMVDTLLAWLQALQGLPAYALVFGALAGSGVGLPVNEDLLLMAAAALTLRGVMDPVLLSGVGWAGIVLADTLVFHWGRRFGAPLLRHRHAARFLPPHRLEAAQASLQRWGPVALAAVRFLPGLRSAVLFAAGAMKLRYRDLWLYDGLAGAVEIPALIYAVRAVGGRWEAILEFLQRWQAVLLPVAGVALLVAVGWLTLRRRRAGG
ncbi:MAG: DedA family protein [Comamonadaceae bacterium]|nr:MAG: DedA family protein [Comamonadaceae bacterium]